MKYQDYSREQRDAELSTLWEEFNQIKEKNITLNMARGVPSPDQLNLSRKMLDILNSESDCFAEDGTDCCNYGVMDGIPECKKLMADVIGLVLQLTVLQGLGSEVGRRDPLLSQDGPGALRPVRHQLFGPCVHRACDQVEDQFPFGLQRPQAFQAVQQDLGIVHVLPQEAPALLHPLPGLQQQGDRVVRFQHLPREGDTGGTDVPHALPQLLADKGLVSPIKGLFPRTSTSPYSFRP